MIVAAPTVLAFSAPPQGGAGAATAAGWLTLDVYGHVTDRMKQESANRMEQFIKAVSGQ